MDKKRSQAYVNLIEQLLSYPQVQWIDLLTANSELVDAGLLYEVERIADYLESQGNNKTQKLRGLAQIIAQVLQANMESEVAARNQAAEFLWEMLQLVAEKQGDPHQIYPIWEQHQDRLNSNLLEVFSKVAVTLYEEHAEQQNTVASVLLLFASLIEQFPFGTRCWNLELSILSYQLALYVYTRDVFPEEWALAQYNLAVAYSNRILGKPVDNIERSIAANEKARQVFTRGAFPEEWATMQYYLAIAYADRTRGERAENIERSIAAIEEALQVYTHNALPKDWATTQNLLGIAYMDRIRGERADNIERAIAAYENALEVYTCDDFPQDWAATQNNLATTYFNRIQGERTDNIERAITAYEKALQVYTRDAFPKEWAQAQSLLGIAYRNRERDERANNIEQAISIHQEVLQVYTHDAFPEEWAQTQNNLAFDYFYRIRGQRADNIEQMITAYENALQVYTRDAFPEQWATTQNLLGNAYFDRIRGEQAENIERAIAGYEKALEAYTCDDFPQDWAATQNNLATTYFNRIQGERADNIERAITTYEKALQVYTRDAFPEEWAQTQNLLGIAYRNRERDERANNIEQAISIHQEVLQVYTRDAFPKQWAQTQNNLARDYVYRIRGQQADKIEQVIIAHENALQVYTRDAFPEEWATTQSLLGIAYFDRIRGERADNIERAITAHENALAVYKSKESPEKWAEVQNNLGVDYVERIRGERADNIERAISLYTEVLQVRTRDEFREEWALTQNNLANAYYKRLKGKREDNLKQAITIYQEILEVRTRDAFPEKWALTKSNLAVAYLEVNNTEQAISMCKEVLQVYTRADCPEKWALLWNNLANAYARHIQGKPANNLEEAIKSYKKALQVYTHEDFPEQWAQTHNNLAGAYQNRIQGDRADNLKQAIIAYEKALQVYTPEAFPNDCRRTARNLGDLHLGQKAWSEAAKAYEIALGSSEELYKACIFLDGTDAELLENLDLPRRAAYALARSGNLQRAAEVLEQNRARGLSKSLDRDRTNFNKLREKNSDLYHQYKSLIQNLRQLESQQRDRMVLSNSPSLTSEDRTSALHIQQSLNTLITQIRQIQGYENFLKQPNFEDICTATALQPNCPLVYLTVTIVGSLALIVTPEKTVDLWIDDFTEIDLLDLLEPWIAVTLHLGFTENPRLDVIDTIIHQFWQPIMEPLVGYLKKQHITQATLIPTGHFSFLPLHAAWTEDPSTPTGRRYALDDIHFTYAPNAKSLTATQTIVKTLNDRGQDDTILAIDEPRHRVLDHKTGQYNPVGSLPSSSEEVASAIATFQNPRILRHDHATRAAVLDTLPYTTILHCSCHGNANTQEPLKSGLAMTGDGEAATLTLKDIFSLNLAENGGLRLAILSACETGLSGIKNADEAISLPTGLLQAGVAGVVASLWSVDDLSTMMLLSRFYDLWRTDNLEPSAALREAQQWIRDTTNQEKYDYLKNKFQPLTNTQQISTQAVNKLLQDFQLQYIFCDGPETNSFVHPYHWAAFSYSGSVRVRHRLKA